MPTITTSQVLVTASALIQNLGPDDLYVADVNPATTSNGFKVEEAESIAVGGGRTYYAVSAGTSDVRVLGGASGVFEDAVS